MIDYRLEPFDLTVLAKTRSEAVPERISTIGASGYSTSSMEEYLASLGMPFLRAAVYARFLWKASDTLNHAISMSSIGRQMSIALNRIMDYKNEFMCAGLITQLTRRETYPNIFGFCKVAVVETRIAAFWPCKLGASRLSNLKKTPAMALASSRSDDDTLTPVSSQVDHSEASEAIGAIP